MNLPPPPEPSASRLRAPDLSNGAALSAERLAALVSVGDELKSTSAADTVAYAYGVGRQVLVWHDDSDGKYFDLASLTKPLFTAPLVLLRAAGRLKLDAPVGDALPWLSPAHSQLTTRQLLTHSAGLPAELPSEGPDPTDVPRHRSQAQTLASPVDDARLTEGDWLRTHDARPGAPGELVVYSDIGYWLLGQLITELAGESLHTVFRQSPMALPGEFKFGLSPQGLTVAAGPRAGAMQWPHDPAARRLGLWGHAGTFGTLTGVISAVLAWLEGSWLPEPIAIAARTCQTHAIPGGHRSLAWTLVGDPYHCVAHDWPTTTLCHSGFTGVCVALDPVSGWWGVYLSNAVPVHQDARPVLKARRLFYAQAAEDLTAHTAAVPA